MRRFAYRYQTRIRFDALVSQHFFRIRCLPMDGGFQRSVSEKLYIHPFDSLTAGVDSFGNRLYYGQAGRLHDTLLYSCEGVVEQKPYRIAEEALPFYRYPSPLVSLSPAMRRFAEEVEMGGEADDWERAGGLSERVHGYMRYQPGATTVSTTAEEAFAHGAGVCQDYAHVLIALCRYAGIPARYASGFLPGEGATHAWVEVLDRSVWRGIDPTNNQQIEYGYIKVAHGRDAADCPVNRGIFTGVASETVEVVAEVHEL